MGINKDKTHKYVVYTLLITILASYFVSALSILLQYDDFIKELAIIVISILPYLWYERISRLIRIKIFGEDIAEKDVVLFGSRAVNRIVLVASLIIYYFFIFILMKAIKIFFEVEGDGDGVVYVVAVIVALVYANLLAKTLRI